MSYIDGFVIAVPTANKQRFIAHASNFDFRTKLYEPLRSSILNEAHEFVLPQEEGTEIVTRDLIKEIDLFVVDASMPSTGAGIEGARPCSASISAWRL